jgi:hypothetical protein
MAPKLTNPVKSDRTPRSQWDVPNIPSAYLTSWNRCSQSSSTQCDLQGDRLELESRGSDSRRWLNIDATLPGKLTPPQNPAQQLTDNYRRFLLDERVLSSRTTDAWVRFIDKFVSERYGASALKLSELSATDVATFVQRHAHQQSPSQARTLISAMRSFLQYLRYKGLIDADLARTVPKVALWSLSSLPKHIPAAVVQRVLDSCDQETPIGRRNYAILLLLSRTGAPSATLLETRIDRPV